MQKGDHSDVVKVASSDTPRDEHNPNDEDIQKRDDFRIDFDSVETLVKDISKKYESSSQYSSTVKNSSHADTYISNAVCIPL